MEATLAQIISDDGKFNDGVRSYINQFGNDLNKNYKVLSIIGAQSSGKSTLLNKLFQTEFRVMEAKSQRKQTTKGIWTHVSAEYNLMIMDIEGADSRERWEEKAAFEKRTALFGLVLSNVFIVNVWLNEIGRFSACNYEILKLIFELNLRFFKTESQKKIVFVIRDFNERENIEYLKKVLITDIDKLWGEVPKSDEHRNLLSSDVFEVHVIPMRSYVYETENFERDVDGLKDMFVNEGARNYLFRGYDSKNIPFDSMFLYMKQIWDTILLNKDINIPNQKAMVSAHRCKEIRAESLNMSMGSFKLVRSKLKDNEKVNLKEEYDRIMSEAIMHFKNSTEYYDEDVREESMKELVEKVNKEFELIFKERNKKLIKDLIGQMKRAMTTLINNNSENSSAVLRSIVLKKDEFNATYDEFLDSYNFSEAKKDEYKENFILEIANQVTSLLSSSANAFIKKLTRNYLKNITDKIFETFQNLTRETWGEFNKLVTKSQQDIVEEMAMLRDNYPEIAGIFTDETIEQTSKDFIFQIKTNLQNRKLYINDYLLSNFKENFELNASGARRNWRALSDGEINNLFKTSRNKLMQTIGFLDDVIRLEADDEIILNREETIRIRQKFSSQINDVLEEAFNKKYNRNSLQRVPKWLWLVLAYFMHDNILEWMKHPILFFLLILSCVGVGYLFATGNFHLLTNAIGFARSFAMAKAMGTAAPPFSDLFKKPSNSANKEKEEKLDESADTQPTQD